MFKILSGIFIFLPFFIWTLTSALVFFYPGKISYNRSGIEEILWSLTGPLSIYAETNKEYINPGLLPYFWLFGLMLMAQHVIFRKIWSLSLALITFILWVFIGFGLMNFD